MAYVLFKREIEGVVACACVCVCLMCVHVAHRKVLRSATGNSFIYKQQTNKQIDRGRKEMHEERKKRNTESMFKGNKEKEDEESQLKKSYAYISIEVKFKSLSSCLIFVQF